MDRKRIRLLAASIAALAIIAGIAAFFTNKDLVTNVFQASRLRIKVIEPNWHPNPTIVPEQEIPKDPFIKNTEETSAYVFMEVTVPVATVTLEKNNYDNENNEKGKKDRTALIPLFRFINSDTADDQDITDPENPAQEINKGWYPMPGYPKPNVNSSGETVSYTYLYAYTGADNNTDDTMAVLSPDETTTTSLFDKVKFCNAREDDTLPGSRQLIDIKAYGIQTEFLISPTQTENKAENVWQYLTK